MVSPLIPAFQFAAGASAASKIAEGDLVVFHPEYRDYDTGCRVVEFRGVEADGTPQLVILRVLDSGPDKGMKFGARMDQIRKAI
jgi:hypothetical protein